MANEYWLGDEQCVVIELLIPAKRRGVKPIRNLLLSFTTANHPISLSALADSACRHVAHRGAGDLLDKDRPVGEALARAVGVYRPGRCIYVVNLRRACSIVRGDRPAPEHLVERAVVFRHAQIALRAPLPE
jgi:hypothetical protein